MSLILAIFMNYNKKNKVTCSNPIRDKNQTFKWTKINEYSHYSLNFKLFVIDSRDFSIIIYSFLYIYI